ncbi:hypothetical protein [Agrobacterium sp. NPDC089420]|uniref:hypothetical protein n=1 Tax=Agrobacterium sp. NPDC089420 TaxID=3363918 RepID=UPI00384E9363
MKFFKKAAFALLTAVALAGTTLPSFATYVSPVSAPSISISNLMETSANWKVGTTVGTVTTVDWDINYASSAYAVQVRVCQNVPGVHNCTGWSTSHDGSSSIFSGKPASAPFYFQARVVTTPYNVGKVIRPTIYGSGNSMIVVNTTP